MNNGQYHGKSEDTKASERCFAFGRNWRSYLKKVDEARTRKAEDSLCRMLEVDTLEGQRFLDAGCGSGLFSLAARRLGAAVHSFDYDPDSVACAQKLKQRRRPDDTNWKIERGSVLNRKYLEALGQFDVVYCWGVVHHTGAMYEALTNLIECVSPNRKLFISIYNDQGAASRRWRAVKRLYNSIPAPFNLAVLIPAFVRLWGPTLLRDALRLRPFNSWRNYDSLRGMSAWHDVVDWVGGYPFQVAKPEEIFDFCRARGLELLKLNTCGGGIGCNEFVFRKCGG